MCVGAGRSVCVTVLFSSGAKVSVKHLIKKARNITSTSVTRRQLPARPSTQEYEQ